jgi:hypothetical protein
VLAFAHTIVCVYIYRKCVRVCVCAGEEIFVRDVGGNVHAGMGLYVFVCVCMYASAQAS